MITQVGRRLVLEPVTSKQHELGISYTHKGGEVTLMPIYRYSGLDGNYYELSGMSENLWISTTGIERAIARSDSRARFNPYFDFFDLLEYPHPLVRWTQTGLRVPKGRKADKYEKDSSGRKYWIRQVLIGDKEIGEFPVPEGNNRVIVEWDDALGLPRITSDSVHYTDCSKFHFNFSPGTELDKISGRRDVAVTVSRLQIPWHPDCVKFATYCRGDTTYNIGFRPVKGELVLPTVLGK